MIFPYVYDATPNEAIRTMYILDVDECTKNTHGCSEKANCTNTPGSYNCECQVGYKGDAHNCSGIDVINIFE